MPHVSHYGARIVRILGVLVFAGCVHAPETSTKTLASGFSTALRPCSGVRVIFEDRRGRLWIGSTDWTCRYDPAAAASGQDPCAWFPEEQLGGLTKEFQEDSEGHIVLRTDGGLRRFVDGRFEPVPERPPEPERRWDIRPGDLWFGAGPDPDRGPLADRWGVHRYRDGVATFLPFPEPEPGDTSGFHMSTSGAMPAPDGRLWFGTFEAAFGFDGSSWQILGRRATHRLDDPLHVGFRGYHLDTRGLLWMADNGAGLFVHDGDDVVHFTALHELRDEDTEGPSLHRSFSVAEATDGTMWFGTAYSGVWRYSPSTHAPIREGEFQHFGPDQGMPCQNIYSIIRTRSGELLFAGEQPGGVYRFDGSRFVPVL